MLRLIIGNKNYSSWSLRPWLLLSEAGIAFEEIRLPLFTPTFAAEIGRYTKAGRVPVLIDPDAEPEPLHVWDTLAIAEYLDEYAQANDGGRLWPRDSSARAHARSICAEMHAGFSTLRNAMPMNVSADLTGHGWSVAVQDDLDRLIAMWRDCLARYGGPLLFGGFTIADAYYAPVVSRMRTYGVALPPEIAAYRDRILALDGMRAWTAAAAAEDDFIADDEPYRRSR